MENEVVIHVRSEDETERGFASARRGAKKLGEDIERDLKQAGKRGGIGLGQGVSDGFGTFVPDIKTSVGTLGEDISGELEKAGKKGGQKLGQGIGDGLSGDGIGSKLIPKIGGAGKAAGETFVDTFGSVLQDLGRNPYVMGGIAAAGAALAPVIGASLAAGVIGAAGGLGIVGGFAAAAQDPRVKGAATALKDVISDDLKLAAAGFVPAAIDAMAQVRGAWKGMLPDLARIFTQSAGLMDPLLDGILDGVSSLVDGIEKSLGGAGPVFKAFGDLFDEVGSALGDVFAMLSDDGDAAAAAIDFLSSALVAAIDALGIFMEASLAVVEAIRPIGGLFADGVNAIDSWINSLVAGGDQTKDMAKWQGEMQGATEDATGATNDQISALRQLEETMRKQTDPLFAVFDLQVKARKAQEDYNKALEEHGPTAAKTRKALLDMGKASFELTSALTTAASEGFNGKLTPAMRSALRNAGNTADQINALEQELIAAWHAANKWSGTYTQTYITRYKEYGLKSPNPGGGFQGHAHGGIVGAATGGMHSGMRMVGEYGPELVNLPPGTQVHSAPDTERMMSGGGTSPLAGSSGQGGRMEIVLRFDPSGAPEAMRGLMEGIRGEVRDGGGNVQVVLGVAGV